MKCGTIETGSALRVLLAVCFTLATYRAAFGAEPATAPAPGNVRIAAAQPRARLIDWRVKDGVREIPIEERSAEEVTHLTGATSSGRIETIRITPEGSPAANYAFDVTPARLVTGLITERGICEASEAGLLGLFPEAEAA